MELIRLILITMFVCLIVMHINNANPSTTQNSTLKPTSLASELKKLKYKFTTDVQLRSQTTDAIEIQIEDPCDVTLEGRRKRCNLNQPDSCKFCPYTACKHFETPVKIGLGTVPRNLKRNEGWCVAMKDMSSACNKHHGDWVMIKASSYIKGNLNPNTYIRFCLCKRPGFIGNVTLFGSCDHPFVCDGDVADINKPYDEIECKCLNEFKSATVGQDGRGCVPPAVEDRVNWATVPKPLKFSKYFIDVQTYFHKIVAGNVKKLEELIDPCSMCPVTGKVTYGRAVNIEENSGNPTVICRPSNETPNREGNYGVPVRRIISGGQRLLKGTWGPDLMLAIQWKELWVYDSDNDDGRKQDCVYVFEWTKYNDDFYQKLGLSDQYQYAINVGKDALLGLTVLPKSSFTPMVVPHCYRGNLEDNSAAPMYTCEIKCQNLALTVGLNDIRDKAINSDKDNIVSTFIFRTKEEPGPYAQSKEYWHSVQKLRCPFGIGLVNLGEIELQYLLYNPEIRSDSNLRSLFPFVAMRVRPMSDSDLNRSNWRSHGSGSLKSGSRHFEVDFVLTKKNYSELFLKKAHHNPDPNFEY